MSGDGASVSANDVQVDLPLKPSARRYRRTKKPRKKVHRWWRTHKDAFEEVWPEAEAQLCQTPYMQAKALFQALQRKYPGQLTAHVPTTGQDLEFEAGNPTGRKEAR